MKLSQITQVLFAMAFSSTHSYLIIYVFHLIKFEMLVFITDTQRLLLNTMFVYFFSAQGISEPVFYGLLLMLLTLHPDIWTIF